MGRAQEIRSKLAGNGRVTMPGVFDALSARLAADAGFEVLFVSGFAVAASQRALPDYGYVAATEMVGVAGAVCAATDLPVIVDADTGYGNALNARDTAQRLHRAGAAGIFLEDQEWPKRCGHFDRKQVIPTDQWLAKLSAVLELRDDGVDLFLVARTDARAAESLDAAIARARDAAALGVDAVFVEAPASEEELARVRDEVPDTIRVANMVEGGRTPLLSGAELADLGHRLVVTPLTGLFAATAALREAYSGLRAADSAARPAVAMTSFDEFGDLVGRAEHEALARHYRAD